LAAAAEAWNSNDRKKALSLLDDNVVQTMCAIGTAEQVADRVSAYHDNGVDVAIILPIATRQGAGDVAANTYFSVAGEMRRRGLMKGPILKESNTLWK
jgi:alkanesulfonate monooxygenase SsuD/methylene tetrahydromethanopterin reductase-like flavin-dependent oxidoreductase (luciferase family)